MIEGWKYQTTQVCLSPYDAAWPIHRDGLLGYLYLQTKESGLLDLFSTEAPLNFDQFVSFFAAENKKSVMQVYETQDHVPVGYGWVAGTTGKEGERRSSVGFMFFRPFWGKPQLRDIGMLDIHYWFYALHIDVLHGYTLVDNFLARNFARKLGFTEVGVMPKLLHQDGKLRDARVLILEKSAFTSRWESWCTERGKEP